MVLFNDALIQGGVDVSRTVLMRHTDPKALRGRSPYELWLKERGAFELYQRLQNPDELLGIDYVASFVGLPRGQTLFVGVYRVNGWKLSPPDLPMPTSGLPAGEGYEYDLELAPLLQAYIGRILVDWSSYVAWKQYAKNGSRRIIELKASEHEPPFPGFMAFSSEIAELRTLPASWQTTLAAASGVYLLTDLKTGSLYVGSAYGQGGFLARWDMYVSSGHGGNVGMAEVPDGRYQVTILETAGSNASANDIVAMEERWKQKLQSRRFGLNRN